MLFDKGLENSHLHAWFELAATAKHYSNINFYMDLKKYINL